ncbi:MAG: tetratricopeptide repeat protein [Deltaproteobacteria bacterium]|jgi:tetratricopeptide (TPR) repeat protein|nr:tetratricopeptide repeat protein [Deltaproteobacteria bacterium]MBW1904495.1 tetratricopeptide repeat protein [Deltaproteobacteria bacterium]MBW2160065.1 tetratricopeptide repeat protein [Deltaproteobacteria bacterium]MBW2375338.1 tetratricopeptide repeat protein [Deltaproteobacteria bacterium]
MAPWAQQILDAANEHYDRAEYPLAQPYYEKLVQQGLRYPDVFNRLGVIYHLGGRLTEARWCFQQALEDNAGYLEAALNLTVTCNELGEYGSGVRTLQQAQRHSDSSNDAYRRGKVANLHRALGRAYLDLDRPEDAMHEFGRALRLCPKFHDIRLELAKLLRLRGNAHGAREELTLILQLDSNHHDARALLGVIEIETGDHKEGLQHLRAVVEQCAGHPVASAYLEQADSDYLRAS